MSSLTSLLLGFFLFTVFSFSSFGRIPGNLRIVPGSQLVINQDLESIEAIEKISNINFQAAVLVYYANKLIEFTNEQKQGALAIKTLIKDLETIAQIAPGMDSSEVLDFGSFHGLDLESAYLAFLVDKIYSLDPSVIENHYAPVASAFINKVNTILKSAVE